MNRASEQPTTSMTMTDQDQSEIPTEARDTGVESMTLLGWQGVCFAPKTGETFLLCLPRQMNLIVRCRYNTLHNSFQTDLRDDGLTAPYFPFHGGPINGDGDYPSDMWQPMPPVPKQWPNAGASLAEPHHNLTNSKDHE